MHTNVFGSWLHPDLLLKCSPDSVAETGKGMGKRERGEEG